MSTIKRRENTKDKKGNTSAGECSPSCLSSFRAVPLSSMYRLAQTVEKPRLFTNTRKHHFHK